MAGAPPPHSPADVTALHDLVVRRILAAGLALATAEQEAGPRVGALCRNARGELDEALRAVARYEFEVDVDVDADLAEARWSAGLDAERASAAADRPGAPRLRTDGRDRPAASMRATVPDRSRLWEDLIACEHDDRRVLDVAVRAVVELIGDEAVAARLDGRGELVPLAFHSADPDGLEQMREVFEVARFRLGEGLAGEVAATGEPLFVPAVPPDVTRAIAVEQTRPYLDRRGLTSLMIVPLRRDGQVIGTLGATRAGAAAPYTDADLRALEQIAELAALVMAPA